MKNMKTISFTLKLFIFLFLILQLVSCSSDNGDVPRIPDTTDQTSDDADEPDGNDENPDSDNDGINDNEDVDDDNDGLIEIFSINGLDDLRNNLDASKKSMLGLANKVEIGFELMANIDFENPDDYDDPSLLEEYTLGAGWEPIGTKSEFNFGEEEDTSTRFGGVFEGNGFTIKNLYINRPDEIIVGLFGACTDSTQIRNLNLELKSVSGNSIVGGLVGLGRGLIENCKVTGSINSELGEIGLLAGRYEGGTISNCNTSGTVTAENNLNAGGLMGRLLIEHSSNNDATVSRCYSTANVMGRDRVGGLIGGFNLGDAINAVITVDHCYAVGNVTGELNVGGLIGFTGGVITECYATGEVTATRLGFGGNSGGLIGQSLSANISSCYATGNVKTTSPLDCMGGLVGFIHSTIVTTSYSTGSVEGNPDQIGGLTGRCPAGSPPSINNTNYWDIETSGLTLSRDEAQGINTTTLQSPTSNAGIYATWDPTIWDFGTTNQYPALKDMPNGLEVQR